MNPVNAKLILIVILLCNLLITPSIARKPHVINFRSPNLYPEGMTYDPIDQHFIVGSLKHRSIHSVSDAGTIETLIFDPSLPQNSTILGLTVDSINRRLLAVIHKGLLASYDIATRRRVFLSLLPIPDDDSNDASDGMVAMANDVTVDFKGNAYVTSSMRNLIWKVDVNGGASIFSRSPAFNKYVDPHAPERCGLNGIAYVNKGYMLVVQSNTGKMFKVDEETGSGRLVLLTENLPLADDIAIRKDGVVLVVSHHNLWFLKSDDNWARGTVFHKTALNSDGFATSVVVGGDRRAYVLYGHVLEGIMQNSKGKTRDLFRIEEVRSAIEGEDENIWIYILVGLGLAYFFVWRFQMKQLVKNMNKKTN
jgi:sugar lactone lactonase YvrE